MKLDGEPVLCHGTVDRNSDCKPIGNNNAAIDSIGRKSENGLENKDQIGTFCDLKFREGAEQLQYAVNDADGWATPELDHSMCTDDITHDDEEKLRNFVAPIPLARSSLGIESFEKDLVSYVDKSVMEPKLPELIVCYRENTYHVVKDICVDDGVPTKDKFLFETNVDEKNLCTFLIPEDINSEIAQEPEYLVVHIQDVLKAASEKENLDMHRPIPDVLISSEEKGSRNEFSVECDSKELMPIREVERDAEEEFVIGASKENFSLGELLSMPEKGAELPKSKFSDNCTDETKQLSQRPCGTAILAKPGVREECDGNEQALLVSPTTGSVAKESDCGHKDAITQSPGPDCAAKASDHGHDGTALLNPRDSGTEESENDSKEETLESHNMDITSDLTSKIGDESYNSKVGSKSMTFDFNSSATKASAGEEGSQTGGCEHPETGNSYKPEDIGSESFSGQFRSCHGESSFSAAGPPSGLISYSGLIAYSGSLSLRSDSSTTSTRSFAFPILQSEWNSSPVRMAKADRRHFRKHRSWRQGLLCCRF